MPEQSDNATLGLLLSATTSNSQFTINIFSLLYLYKISIKETLNIQDGISGRCFPSIEVTLPSIIICNFALHYQTIAKSQKVKFDCTCPLVFVEATSVPFNSLISLNKTTL